MKVGDKVKRSPKIWKAPAMQFTGVIVETVKKGDPYTRMAGGGTYNQNGFKVDHNRYSVNPWNNKKEKDAAVFYTATELVLVK